MKPRLSVAQSGFTDEYNEIAEDEEGKGVSIQVDEVDLHSNNGKTADGSADELECISAYQHERMEKFKKVEESIQGGENVVISSSIKSKDF